MRALKPYAPDFSTAFEHFCIHPGGKAVISEVGLALRGVYRTFDGQSITGWPSDLLDMVPHSLPKMLCILPLGFSCQVVAM